MQELEYHHFYSSADPKKEKVYKPSDLPFLHEVSKEAQALWDSLADQYMKMNPSSIGCWGSCVIGEGFSVPFLPKRKRIPQNLFIAKASGAACCGSLPWESCIEVMQAFFKAKGIKAYFYYGRMD